MQKQPPSGANVSGVVLRCESDVANAVFDVGREAVVAVRTWRVCGWSVTGASTGTSASKGPGPLRQHCPNGAEQEARQHGDAVLG